MTTKSSAEVESYIHSFAYAGEDGDCIAEISEECLEDDRPKLEILTGVGAQVCLTIAELTALGKAITAFLKARREAGRE